MQRIQVVFSAAILRMYINDYVWGLNMSVGGRRGKSSRKKFLVFARVVLFFGAVGDVMYTFVYILGISLDFPIGITTQGL